MLKENGKILPALQIVSTCKVYTSRLLLYITSTAVFAVGTASALITSTERRCSSRGGGNGVFCFLVCWCDFENGLGSRWSCVCEWKTFDSCLTKWCLGLSAAVASACVGCSPLSLSPFQNITDIEGYFKQELNISSVTTHIFPTRLPLEGLEALWVSKRGTSFPVVIRLFNLKHLALNFTSHYSVRRRTVCTLVAAVYCSRVTACMCSRNDCM